jgi:hypothetical protein
MTEAFILSLLRSAAALQELRGNDKAASVLNRVADLYQAGKPIDEYEAALVAQLKVVKVDPWAEIEKKLDEAAAALPG